MKLHNLSSVAAVVLVLVLLPAVASAQRGGWHHGRSRGGPVFASPVVVVGQPVVAVPMVVTPIVVGPPVVVHQPFVGGVVPFGNFPRTGFGTIPVRTGFGTVPVRTGFEVAPFGAGFGVVPVVPVVITVPPGHVLAPGGFRPIGRGHVRVRGH